MSINLKDLLGMSKKSIKFTDKEIDFIKRYVNSHDSIQKNYGKPRLQKNVLFWIGNGDFANEQHNEFFLSKMDVKKNKFYYYVNVNRDGFIGYWNLFDIKSKVVNDVDFSELQRLLKNAEI